MSFGKLLCRLCQHKKGIQKRAKPLSSCRLSGKICLGSVRFRRWLTGRPQRCSTRATASNILIGTKSLVFPILTVDQKRGVLILSNRAQPTSQKESPPWDLAEGSTRVKTTIIRLPRWMQGLESSNTASNHAPANLWLIPTFAAAFSKSLATKMRKCSTILLVAEMTTSLWISTKLWDKSATTSKIQVIFLINKMSDIKMSWGWLRVRIGSVSYSSTKRLHPNLTSCNFQKSSLPVKRRIPPWLRIRIVAN